MEWTTETPTEAGFYWYKDEDFGATVVQLRESHREADELDALLPGYGTAEPLADLNGEWCGPLSPPT